MCDGNAAVWKAKVVSVVCVSALINEKLDEVRAEFLISCHARRYSHANKMKGQHIHVSEVKCNV